MLLMIKIFSLLLILVLSSIIGYLISQRYVDRVAQLRDLIMALDIFETRINYTYDSIPDCFSYIAEQLNTDVAYIFSGVCEEITNHRNMGIGDCFIQLVEEEKQLLELKKTDVEILKGLSVSLGQVDLEGQVKNIRLISSSLKKQLEEAMQERDKNFKIYRNMGVLAGFMIMILLV